MFFFSSVRGERVAASARSRDLGAVTDDPSSGGDDQVLAGFSDIARIADSQGQTDVLDNLISNLCKFTMLPPTVGRPQEAAFAEDQKAGMAARVRHISGDSGEDDNTATGDAVVDDATRPLSLCDDGRDSRVLLP